MTPARLRSAIGSHSSTGRCIGAREEYFRERPTAEKSYEGQRRVEAWAVVILDGRAWDRTRDLPRVKRALSR